MTLRHWCAAVPDGVRLHVLVAPNARKTEISGLQDGALKIRLQAQPVDGKANEALVRFLAERLGVPRKAVAVTRGLTSRDKSITVSGLDCAAVAAALWPADGAPAGDS